LGEVKRKEEGGRGRGGYYSPLFFIIKRIFGL
jgi:hypothetical protein